MQVAAVQAAPENVRAFIQEYFDAWKGTDEDKILAYYSDDVVIHLPTGTLEGKTDVRDNFVRPFITAFPGNVHSIRNLAHAKNLVAVEWTFDAVHKGGFGKIEATGKRFRFLVVPSTSTTSDPERFRQEGSTSILLRSWDKLARERKSPGGLTRNHVTSLIQHGTRPAANLPRNRGEKF